MGLVPSDDVLRQLAVFWIGDVVAIACVTPTVLLVGQPWLGDGDGVLQLE